MAARMIARRVLSCGVLVTDGRHLVIGHATRSVRWDIPKGQTEAGETAEDAARRELAEETGLAAPAGALAALGEYRYRPGKDLALFTWLVPDMPDPATLRCTSTFTIGGHLVPELDRFDCPTWPEALPRLAKSMAAVLDPIARQQGWL
jgi:putative (di)nucleoside polyphosphate hydrolase